MNKSVANKKTYIQLYKTNDSAFSYEVRVKKEIVKKLLPRISQKAHILEIGYGTGDVLHFLSEKYPKSKITGYEFVDEASELYKKRFPNDKNVKLQRVDISKKFVKRRDIFDIVIASHVLEHIKNDGDVFRQIHSLLKRNGIFMLVVPDWGDFDNDLHYRQYAKNDMIEIAKEYNFKLVTLVGDGYVFNRAIYYFFLWVTKYMGESAGNLSGIQASSSKRKLFKILYYGIIVNIFLYLNKVDTFLFSNVVKKPMQWIALYKK